MPLAGFEPTVSASERPQTYALAGAAIGTGRQKNLGNRGNLVYQSAVREYYSLTGYDAW